MVMTRFRFSDLKNTGQVHLFSKNPSGATGLKNNFYIKILVLPEGVYIQNGLQEVFPLY